jgi:hypothetical protein
VRQFSEKVGGSLAVMNGLEAYPVGPFDFKRTEFKTAVEQIAAAVPCKVQAYPGYWFLYPEGYEAALDVTVAGKLDPAFANVKAGMTFGGGTHLFEMFALLSATMHITLLADNIIAETGCGTLTLAEIPLEEGLDAVLKSARLRAGTFQIESTPEYIFLYATQNSSLPSALLNAEALSPEQQAVLDRKVDVAVPELPDGPAQMAVPPGATLLAKALPILSKRLGVPITVEDGLQDLPVNPFVFSQVRVRTAMDLLIRQWPLPEFGYEFANNQFVIMRRK